MPPTTPGAGGSAGGGGQEVQCDTAFDRTGTLRSDGIFTSMLINNFVIVGDEGNTNLAQRGIVSVVLNQIPAGANVESVILQIMGSAPEGNPFDDFGFMTVDHIDVVANIGATAFLGKTLTANIATIDTLPGGLMQQTVALDVTAQVQADLAAGRPISSFRFQFTNAPSLDGVFDQVFFAANQNDASARPIAIATFTP
ncbi:MAG TPA: hypothetical protein VJZ71_18440 [Phycisphaerae bacterium]|nr:hypothetical protein [Phycisphaerae bacterium]